MINVQIFKILQISLNIKNLINILITLIMIFYYFLSPVALANPIQSVQISQVTSINEVQIANENLKKLFDSAKTPEKFPILADKIASHTILLSFDVSALSAASLSGYNNEIDAVCASAQKNSERYLDAGLVPIANIDYTTAKTFLYQNNNIVKYQDEYNKAQIFLLKCHALFLNHEVEFLNRNIAARKNPGLALAAETLRGAFASAYEHDIIAMAQLKCSNQSLLLRSLAAYSDIYANALRPADRKKILKIFSMLQSHNKFNNLDKSDINKLIKAMSESDCVNFCSI